MKIDNRALAPLPEDIPQGLDQLRPPESFGICMGLDQTVRLEVFQAMVNRRGEFLDAKDFIEEMGKLENFIIHGVAMKANA